MPARLLSFAVVRTCFRRSRRHFSVEKRLWFRSSFNLRSTMESFFVVKDATVPEQKTFWKDDYLPSLPLPTLDDTLGKYLDSCKAVLTGDEYERTQEIVNKFKSNEGPRLHKILEEKSKRERNWLDKWWLDGYLEYRGSSGYLNFSGLPRFSYWPFNGDQIRSSALQLHIVMRFWSLLREGKLRQQKNSKGNNFSMYQFRYIFNTCRIPLPGRDELSCCFRTVYDGPCPSHLIIFYRKRMYKIPGLCSKTGEIYTPSQFYQILSEIVKETEPGQNIALMSELDRDKWAEARSHLIKLSSENERNIKDIDSAVMCLSLEDKKKETDTELMTHAMAGSYGQRWTDKFNYICEKNGQFGVHSDHTPLDGMVFVTFVMYSEAIAQTTKQGLEKIWGEDGLPVEQPVGLNFAIDDKIKNWITEGRKVAENIESVMDCRMLTFDKFGRTGLKKLGRIHQCAFVEICLQLAYMRKHGKPAATYETATTRTFYKGRTETLRTCTPESVAFCRAMIDGGSDRQTLFKEACKKYSWLVDECREARGCDRHLLGLSSIAAENGEELPELFKDEAYTKSGGNGNYLLSTSFVGYNSHVAGGVLPMREDGYGTFFGINDESIYFAITAYKLCTETSAGSFSEYLAQALTDVYDLMLQNSRL